MDTLILPKDPFSAGLGVADGRQVDFVLRGRCDDQFLRRRWRVPYSVSAGGETKDELTRWLGVLCSEPARSRPAQLRLPRHFIHRRLISSYQDTEQIGESIELPNQRGE